MMRSCDVLVVGAGPAGALAALGLARSGLDVVIAERARFPRDKVCGDALLPDAVAALDEAGVADLVRASALDVSHAVFRSPRGHMLEIGGRFLTIRRTELDAILVEAARRAGAALLDGTRVVGPLVEGGEIVGAAMGSGACPSHIRARIVVLACGSQPRLLDAFGVLTRTSHSAIALRGYLTEDPFPWISAHGAPLFISYDRALLPGYGWSFPLPDRGWNVGCGLFLSGNTRRVRRSPREPDLRDLLDRFLERTGSGTAGEIRGATLRTGFTGAVPVRGRVLVVGEGLGLTLPLTGDGIGKAMQSGLIAARAIAAALAASGREHDLRLYARELERRLRGTYRAYGAAQRWMRLPVIPDIIVGRAARSRDVRRLVEEVVAERADPRSVLSPRGLLRVLTSPRDPTERSAS